MVDCIIMDQRRQVNELDERGKRYSMRMRAIANAVGQQQQRGPKQLSPRPKQVVIHLFDRGEITQHNAPQLTYHTFELVTYRSLDFAELWEPGAKH
jgi:hypothetical protein